MPSSLDGDLSHGALLSDSLQRLQLQAESSSDHPPNPDIDPRFSSPSRLRTSVLHEGYGFRPTSGSSTPPQNAVRNDSPLPDRNGLGWPGEFQLK